MKILVLAIAASVTIVVIASISLFILPDNRPTCFSCPEISTPTSQLLATNNSSVQNASIVIIPQGAEDPSSGKNYEPQYLHVVIGVNNTVKWINVDTATSSIFADNQNDPDFFNATNTQTNLPNYKLPNNLQ